MGPQWCTLLYDKDTHKWTSGACTGAATVLSEHDRPICRCRIEFATHGALSQFKFNFNARLSLSLPRVPCHVSQVLLLLLLLCQVGHSLIDTLTIILSLCQCRCVVLCVVPGIKVRSLTQPVFALV